MDTGTDHQRAADTAARQEAADSRSRQTGIGTEHRRGFGGWWTWFRREVLCWSHPDSGLDLLVEGYGSWLQTLARGPVVEGEATAASGYYGAQDRAKLAEVLGTAMRKGWGGLPEMMAIESQLTNLYSDARLSRRLWSFQDRFRRVAAGPAAAAYLFSDPPKIKDDAVADKVSMTSSETAETRAETDRSAIEGAETHAATTDSNEAGVADTDVPERGSDETSSLGAEEETGSAEATGTGATR